jgi:hypothetical protein
MQGNCEAIIRRPRVHVNEERPSFRDTPLGVGPESITPVAMIYAMTKSRAEHRHREYGYRARASRAPGRIDMTSHSRDRPLPEVCKTFRPERRAHATLKRGRGEDRVRAAPAVSCASCTKENAHEHTGSAEAVRPSLRNGFTVSFVLSPATGLIATVTSDDAKHHRQLDASIGASGPHDFAVRCDCRSSRA